jgi:hypothetical protein
MVTWYDIIGAITVMRIHPTRCISTAPVGSHHDLENPGKKDADCEASFLDS